MSSLLIIPMLPIEREIIEKLSAPLQKRLHLTIDIHARILVNTLILHAINTPSVLLSHILEQFKYYNGKIVGITGVDLFVPIDVCLVKRNSMEKRQWFLRFGR